MTPFRVHILGGSGSGTTTLGAELAQRVGCAHLDTDTFFWVPTDPPFREIRSTEARQRMLADALAAQSDWVLSGSATGWGDFALPLFTAVVFLTLPGEERLCRVKAREQRRRGTRIELGGDMHASHLEFLQWVANYDTDRLDMRTIARHEQWLRGVTCPVLRLDGTRPVGALASEVIEAV